jgi:hypothetical protein
MSSESSDRKPESIEPGPPSGAKARRSSRAPSAWGQARDAVASVHNLAALLRSASVKYKVIRDLLPELRTGARVLVDLFASPGDGHPGEDEASREVCAYGLAGASELQELLDATDIANDEREDLTARALRLADQLEASCDLLALLERASSPVPTSVSLRLIVRETQRLWGGTRGAEITVRFDDASPDASIEVDPYVVGPLLSLVLALSQAAGAGDVVLRASSSGAATLVVEPAGAAEASLRTVPVRILPAVPPTATAAHQVARQIGAVLELQGPRAVLRFPGAAG